MSGACLSALSCIQKTALGPVVATHPFDLPDFYLLVGVLIGVAHLALASLTLLPCARFLICYCRWRNWKIKKGQDRREKNKSFSLIGPDGGTKMGSSLCVDRSLFFYHLKNPTVLCGPSLFPVLLPYHPSHTKMLLVRGLDKHPTLTNKGRACLGSLGTTVSMKSYTAVDAGHVTACRRKEPLGTTIS